MEGRIPDHVVDLARLVEEKIGGREGNFEFRVGDNRLYGDAGESDIAPGIFEFAATIQRSEYDDPYIKLDVRPGGTISDPEVRRTVDVYGPFGKPVRRIRATDEGVTSVQVGSNRRFDFNSRSGSMTGYVTTKVPTTYRFEVQQEPLERVIARRVVDPSDEEELIVKVPFIRLPGFEVEADGEEIGLAREIGAWYGWYDAVNHRARVGKWLERDLLVAERRGLW